MFFIHYFLPEVVIFSFNYQRENMKAHLFSIDGERIDKTFTSIADMERWIKFYFAEEY